MDVLSELDTLEACRALSIARFGDGELRIAAGGSCSSQVHDPKLQAELLDLLRKPQPCVVAIPNFERTPRQDVWKKYSLRPYSDFFKQPQYGSSFITRPDNAPWIDTPDYWALVRELWRDRDVTLVVGDEKSLTPAMLSEAHSVGVVRGPRTNAYAEIDRIEAEIGDADLVIMCLGACATALAGRLARRGIQALDLGHMGMFMRHAGLYAITKSQVASNDYRKQLQEKHATTVWGKSGHSHAPEVRAFAAELGANSILDYGCGRGTLATEMKERRVMEYDPGIKGKDHLPKPCDLVVCTDVLEHIEPELIDNVLSHLYLLAGKGAYLVIATRLARELLPDGRNAHLTVQPSAWWLMKLGNYGWRSMRHEERKGLCVWLRK